MPKSPGPPAGWYDHPEMAQTVRYWDDSGWTDQVAPKSAAPASSGMAGTSADWLALIGVAGAIFLPIVGFIVGFILMAKNRPGVGVFCVLLSIAAFFFWWEVWYDPAPTYDRGY